MLPCLVTELSRGYHVDFSLILNLSLYPPPTHTHTHTHTHTQVICAVVQEYVDKVSECMPEIVSDLETACMLLNNIQALRVNVEILYGEMGGDKVRVH